MRTAYFFFSRSLLFVMATKMMTLAAPAPATKAPTVLAPAAAATATAAVTITAMAAAIRSCCFREFALMSKGYPPQASRSSQHLHGADCAGAHRLTVQPHGCTNRYEEGHAAGAVGALEDDGGDLPNHVAVGRADDLPCSILDLEGDGW